MCSEENKTGNPNTNEIQQKIYWLKNKLWEEGWKGFNNEEQSKTIELLNLLIEEQNFNKIINNQINNEPKFQVVTQEILEKMSLKFYGGGKELKVGDLIISGCTIIFASLSGKSQTAYYYHDEANNLNFNIFVWDNERNTLFQLYKIRTQDEQP